MLPPLGRCPQKEKHMELDRRVFIASLGGAAAVNLMDSEAKADALEARGVRVGRTPTETAEIAVEVLGRTAAAAT